MQSRFNIYPLSDLNVFMPRESDGSLYLTDFAKGINRIAVMYRWKVPVGQYLSTRPKCFEDTPKTLLKKCQPEHFLTLLEL